MNTIQQQAKSISRGKPIMLREEGKVIRDDVRDIYYKGSVCIALSELQNLFQEMADRAGIQKVYWYCFRFFLPLCSKKDCYRLFELFVSDFLSELFEQNKRKVYLQSTKTRS